MNTGDIRYGQNPFPYGSNYDMGVSFERLKGAASDPLGLTEGETYLAITLHPDHFQWANAQLNCVAYVNVSLLAGTTNGLVTLRIAYGAGQEGLPKDTPWKSVGINNENGLVGVIIRDYESDLLFDEVMDEADVSEADWSDEDSYEELTTGAPLYYFFWDEAGLRLDGPARRSLLQLQPESEDGFPQRTQDPFGWMLGEIDVETNTVELQLHNRGFRGNDGKFVPSEGEPVSLTLSTATSGMRYVYAALQNGTLSVEQTSSLSEFNIEDDKTTGKEVFPLYSFQVTASTETAPSAVELVHDHIHHGCIASKRLANLMDVEMATAGPTANDILMFYNVGGTGGTADPERYAWSNVEPLVLLPQEGVAAGADGLDGEDGMPGDTGPTGPTGPAGATGEAVEPSLTIGTVTTGTAAANISGESPDFVLNLTLPEGGVGDITSNDETIAVTPTGSGVDLSVNSTAISVITAWQYDQNSRKIQIKTRTINVVSAEDESGWTDAVVLTAGAGPVDTGSTQNHTHT